MIEISGYKTDEKFLRIKTEKHFYKGTYEIEFFIYLFSVDDFNYFLLQISQCII